MKPNFEIKDDKLIFELPKVNKRQFFIIGQLKKNNEFSKLISYIQSFRTNRSHYQRVNIDHVDQRGNFELADQLVGNKNRMIRQFEALLNSTNSFKPTLSNKKYVGIEIECIFPNLTDSNDECENCDGRGVYENDDGDEHDCDSCDGSGSSSQNESNMLKLRQLFKKENIPRVSIKEDGSIEDNDDYFAVEFNILCQMDDLSNLEKTCAFLNKHKAKVNSSCGMHIHLDARHIDDKEQLEVIRKNYERSMKLLVSMVPKSRRDNAYCKASVSPISTTREDRYHAVNMTAYKKFKTIEIRLHSSTIDFNKIKQWILLNHAIMNAKITRQCLDLNTLTNFCFIPENTIEYFTQRIDLFKDIKVNVEYQDTDDEDYSLEAAG